MARGRTDADPCRQSCLKRAACTTFCVPGCFLRDCAASEAAKTGAALTSLFCASLRPNTAYNRLAHTQGAASPISQAGVRVDVARSDDALKLLRVAERLLDELLARQQQRLDLQEKEKHEMAADLELLQQNEANAGVSSEHIQLLQQQLVSTRYLKGFHPDAHAAVPPSLRQVLKGPGLWGEAMNKELASFGANGCFLIRIGHGSLLSEEISARAAAARPRRRSRPCASTRRTGWRWRARPRAGRRRTWTGART